MFHAPSFAVVRYTHSAEGTRSPTCCHHSAIRTFDPYGGDRSMGRSNQ